MKEKQPVFASLLGLFCGLLILLRPIDDYDIFTQLTLGSFQLAEESIDSITYFGQIYHPGGIPNPGWLWQIIFAAVFEYGGWMLFSLAHALMFATTIFFLLLCSQQLPAEGRPETWKRSAIEACCIAFLGMAVFTSLRPQLTALLCFSCAWYLLLQPKFLLRHYVYLFSLLLFWQNCHLSVVLSAPLVVARFIRELEHAKRLSRKATLEFLSLGLLIVLSHVSTPLGMQVFSLSSINYSLSHNLFRNLEWLSLWEYELSRNAALLPGIGLALLLAFFLRKQTALWQWAILLQFSALACFAARFTLFWFAATLPLFVYWLDCLRRDGIRWLPMELMSEVHRYFRWSILLLLLILIGWGVAKRPLMDKNFPYSCAHKIVKQPRISKVYTYAPWGSFISFLSKGQIQVQADGRLYLYPESYWLQHFQELQGKAPLPEEFPFEAILLESNISQDLVRTLDADESWRKIPTKQLCHAYVRNARPKAAEIGS